MIDLTQIPEDRLSQTQKAMRQQIIKRGWQAQIPYIGSAYYFITRLDGKKMRTFSMTSPDTTYMAGSLANDKYAAYQLLNESSIPQLDTLKVNESTNFSDIADFLNLKKRVVVKPIDGGHGNGITINITNEEDLKNAITIAIKATKNVNAVLIQEQYPHENIYDLRILIVGYSYVAAIQRVAARVYGDGQSTVGQLIEKENSSEHRGKPYYAKLATIDIERAYLYLGSRVSDVPKIGEEVQVMGVANYGAGGETIDVTDDIPDWLITQAEDIAKTCELPVAGVDYMLARVPQKDMSVSDLDASFTEVNKAPLLSMHDTPTQGKCRGAVEKYFDYLDSL